MHLTEGSFQINVFALWEKCAINECKCVCNTCESWTLMSDDGHCTVFASRLQIAH